jgi:hypothetical protein
MNHPSGDSHKERVLQALLAGERLNENAAYARFGFRCIVQYVKFLRDDGWDVRGEWVKGTRGRWKDYWLDPRSVRPKNADGSELSPTVKLINSIAPFRETPPQVEAAAKGLF